MSAAAFAAMKPLAYFVNVARGKVADEAALIATLQAGKIAGAALDVTAEEPLPAGSPLWDLPNVLITPHTAGETRAYEDNVIDILMENLERLWRGETDLKESGAVSQHRRCRLPVNMPRIWATWRLTTIHWEEEEHAASSRVDGGSRCHGRYSVGVQRCARAEERRRPEDVPPRQSAERLDPRGGDQLHGHPLHAGLQQPGPLRSACGAEQPRLDRARSGG